MCQFFGVNGRYGFCLLKLTELYIDGIVAQTLKLTDTISNKNVAHGMEFLGVYDLWVICNGICTIAALSISGDAKRRNRHTKCAIYQH